MLRLPRLLSTAFLAAASLLTGCSTRTSDEGALARGDVAFATGDFEEALAEYQLAVRQGESAEAYARAGHTYVEMGRVDEAREYYGRATEQDPRWADQAGSDLLHLARAADSRSDEFQMASAVETAVSFLPGLSVEELSLPLARHYFRSGEFGRALPFYKRALGATADSTSEVLMEVGTAYEEVGDCEPALEAFERDREKRPTWDRSEVDWHVGNCSYQLAKQRFEEGLPAEALELINRTLEVGEPRNLLAQVWFDKGEILSETKDCEGAIAAYRRVRQIDPTGTSPLVRKADDRIDEVRFGAELRDIRGRC